MHRKARNLARRQFLYGGGGFALALPWLPSLLPSGAKARAPREPRFVAIASNHGGLFEDKIFPPERLLGPDQPLYPGHAIRSGTLRATQQGGQSVISEVLRAPTSELTSSLVAKMNVLRGLDIPFYIGHHTGGHLGNFARNDGNGSEGKEAQRHPMPTIDQLMAWSARFYPDLTGIRLRSIVTGKMGRLCWGYSNPSARTGDIQEVRSERDPVKIFNAIFEPTSGPSGKPRQPIVDRVIESYRSLKQSNRRLSGADRQRLDDHMDRLSELQRRLSTRVRHATCNDLSAPASSTDPRGYYQALNDVIAAAFLCGASRIAVVGVVEEVFVAHGGDWHQAVAHQWEKPDAQLKLQQANGAVFREVFLDLARKLDVEDGAGSSVLDSTLIVWCNESGEETHNARSMPVITAGSAAGFLKTGVCVDYRRRTQEGMTQKWGKERGYSGLTYNQWLATVLQAMGLPQKEWQGVEHNGPTGYGYPYVSDAYRPTHAHGVIQNASDVLPLLKA
ncbi:MAG: DUF1552 domain-containing protein [Proteobacteria bacterium]|nr:DUF1552 domain-containing protein [Pseudomonadota bacterium]